MDCACIGILRSDRIDDSCRKIFHEYEKAVIEDTCWFSIELEWHMEPSYTDFEKQQLIEVFGKFPEQEILIFGECDRIFVAAYEIIKHFGGMLYVNLGYSKSKINKYPGRKIPVYEKKYRNPSRHNPDKWLVDNLFIKEYFKNYATENTQKFYLAPFINNN